MAARALLLIALAATHAYEPSARPRHQKMPAARPPPKKRRPQPKRLVFKPPGERLKLPSVEKIIEDPSDPHSSLRAAQEGDLGRLADLGNAGWDFPRVRDRNGCGLVHRAAGIGLRGVLLRLARDEPHRSRSWAVPLGWV